MKKSFNKILSILLSLMIVFSISTVPASAVNVYEENKFHGYNEVYDYGNEEDKNFFEKIADTFHWYIARIFFYFEADCPICGEHFLPPDIDSAEEYYNRGVNALKEYKGVITIKKVTTTDIITKDVPDVVAAIVNPVCENLAGTTENTYTFISGKTIDGTEISSVLAPAGRKAALINYGIDNSFAEINTDKNIPISMRIQLISETENYDGTATVNGAVYNNSVTDTINFAALDLGPIKIHEAEIAYPGTEIYVLFDDLGRITSLKIVKPAEIYTTGKVGPITATVNFETDITEEYTITYVS